MSICPCPASMSERMTLKNTPDITDIGVENDIPKICYNILIYIYMKNILTNQEKQIFQKNCINVVVNIKQSLPDDATKDEISEFILSLIHMRSLNIPTIQKYNEEAIKNFLLTFDKSLNENEALEKAKDLLTFNNFINDKSNIKNIQEVLVLNSRNDEFMNEPKMNLFDKLLKEFNLFNNYLHITADKIDIAKGRLLENFLNIKEENFCSNYLHLCQKFYEQSIIYYRLKIIFENLIEYVDTNSKIFKKDKLLDLLNLEYKINKPSKIHTNYVLGDEILFPKLKLTDIYNYEKVIVEVKSDDYNYDTPTYEKGSEKIVDGRFLVTVKNLRKEINDEHLYADLMKTVKNYVLAITIIDKDIANMVRELDYEDMEKFLVDLNFFLYYGFLRIEEDKHMVTVNDVAPTFTNLYRANQIIMLYLLKTGYEENKNSEYLTFNFYKNMDLRKVPNEKAYTVFRSKSQLTGLPKVLPDIIRDFYLEMYPSLPEEYEITPADRRKFQFYFIMAFKDCNINQSYSNVSKEIWMELLYVFDNFGWFYFNPRTIISSFYRFSFVRQVLVSRNFILRYTEPLAYLDTQVSKLIDIIHLSMEMDKSKHALKFNLTNRLFNSYNDYNELKLLDRKRLLYTYDYIDSIANNYYFHTDIKYQVYKMEYSNKLYTNFPNVYSLAYQLFNELAINMNVITNTPLKKKLKDKSKYAYFTIMNIVGKNHDIYSKGPRLIYAAYMLALVFFIEAYIDISRYQPKDYFFMKQSMPLISTANKSEFNMLKKRCEQLHNFMIINKSPVRKQHVHIEEYIKLLSLTTVVLWGKESKKSVYYDDDVSLYKKLMISCIFNGGKTIQEKVIEHIRKACDVKFYGLDPRKLDDFVDINLSISKWNPDILEKKTQSFILSCKLQTLMYDSMDIENITLQSFYKLAYAPEMLKTYHCFKLGRQAVTLLESIILKKKFVRFRVSDAMDVYDFFYIKKVLSDNVKKDFDEFLHNKYKYEKVQNEIIINSSPLGPEETKRLIDNHKCYWFNSYENFKVLWMHVSSNMGTGTYLKNFFSEIWQNLHFVFKKKISVQDVEFFAGTLGSMANCCHCAIGRLGDWAIRRLGDWTIGRLDDWTIGQSCEISQMNLIDYYSPLVLSEAHCQEKMQALFISLRDDHEQNRVDIPDKIKTAYYQCKLSYYRNHLTDAAHIIQPSDFLEGRVYVLKQPYYLISNIDNTHRKKNIRLFLTENTLDYLLLDNIQIPECLGRCTIQHFNKVVLVNSNTKKDDIVIHNGLVPENTISKKRKEMIVYVNDVYIHNLVKDSITNEEITRKDFLEGNVRVCLGRGTYFKKHFLTENHFNLKHIPVYDFTNEHNFKIFLRKNKTMVSKNPNDICFVNYKLSLTNIEINDPYREISEDLIKNLYILKNK
ncbi:high molecular weight rhoptry protein 2 [Plasmodium ovale curtisi]|uniref:High molecular weight rhoptry protein 2 n=1 Tax=Plasmodium ovale curtisi TaxID=864141 RepID=A0A1A8VPH9_PLAOA|nr:high molecular weight rhoptry protein 2 [Plasmodium ovale curtisi]